MNDKLEKAKDILYNISDYLIMIGIIVAIGLIIGWRLEILFPQTTAMVNPNNTTKLENETPQKVDKLISEEAKPKDDTSTPIKDTTKSNDIINISIPQGTHSSGIGDILLDKGIIQSTKEFEEKVTVLDLEKSLRSGEYDIAKNSSLESIIKTIANKN